MYRTINRVMNRRAGQAEAAAERRAAQRKERIKLTKAAKARALYAQRYPHGKRAELKRKTERNDLSTEDIKRLRRLEGQRQKEDFKK
ncbi:MAG: hypothetical protein JO136_22650 [Hyphomicrobiales bacterium]|nr:hypothetical protein [Hyphomicrobiales bacterium]